ncbi:hypothetical protein NKH77_50095 [Streptomyces sp. M19]
MISPLHSTARVAEVGDRRRAVRGGPPSPSGRAGTPTTSSCAPTPSPPGARPCSNRSTRYGASGAARRSPCRTAAALRHRSGCAPPGTAGTAGLADLRGQRADLRRRRGQRRQRAHPPHRAGSGPTRREDGPVPRGAGRARAPAGDRDRLAHAPHPSRPGRLGGAGPHPHPFREYLRSALGLERQAANGKAANGTGANGTAADGKGAFNAGQRPFDEDAPRTRGGTARPHPRAVPAGRRPHRLAGELRPGGAPGRGGGSRRDRLPGRLRPVIRAHPGGHRPLVDLAERFRGPGAD